MERVILHVDCNKFYASVECLHRPELRDQPLAVGGDPEQRHGIILTANQLAKSYGVQTGEALWQAKQKCKDLVIVPPDYQLYLRFSNLVRKICLDYTDKVESFGLDESWLDVTGSACCGSGFEIAQNIGQRVKRELGITVSIGLSYNKIFAKLGSDYKKPDAITVITKDNFKDVVWPLPVGELLMVGRATRRKLESKCISTIGKLANTDPDNLHRWLGKMGDILHAFANGLDCSPVADYDARQVIKSIGNSTTTPRDLETDEDVKMVMIVLAESVARRMREQGFKGRVISISIRDNQLLSFIRQHKIPKYTNLSSEIINEAMLLFIKNYHWTAPIRSVGVSVSDFEHDHVAVQTDLFVNEAKREKLESLEKAVDVLRRRYGTFSVQKACLLSDRNLTQIDPKNDHIIHPIGFF